MEQEKNTKHTEHTARRRRNILHVLCGGYLCYLAYQLGTAFAAGITEKGWTGEMIISLLGTVVFALVGLVLLINAARRMIAQNKKDDEKENY